MTKLNGGAQAKSGYYWNLNRWSVIPMPKEGPLPGASTEKYLRIPLLAAFLLTPVMGALLVVFLPVIGFVLTFYALARPVIRIFRREAGELAATVHPGWKPGEAHFTGRGHGAENEEKGPPSAAHGSEELERVEREIAEKRGEKK
jgi:hypothetical protein